MDPATGEIGMRDLTKVPFVRAQMKSGQTGSIDFGLLSPDEAKGFLTFHHELTHWIQHIGTAYGHLITSIDSGVCQTAINTVKRLRILDKGIRIKKPLLRWALLVGERVGDREADPVEEYVLNQVAGACTEQNVWAYMEGVTISDSATASRQVEALCCGYEESDRCVEFWRRVADQESSSKVSSCPLGLDSLPLGGHALLEGHARACEWLLYLTAPRQEDAHSLTLDEPSEWFGDYSRAFDLFLNKRGLRRSAVLARSKWIGLLTEFTVLCDLALETPIAAPYRRLWSNSMRWRDFHPGWRFLKLLELSDRSRDWLEDDLNDKYRRTVEMACIQFGWPTLDQFRDVRVGRGGTHGELIDRARKFKMRYPAIFTSIGLPNTAPRKVWDEVYKECTPPPLLSSDGTFGLNIGPGQPVWYKPNVPGLSYASVLRADASIYDIAHQVMFCDGPFQQSFVDCDVEPILQLFGLSLNEVEYLS